MSRYSITVPACVVQQAFAGVDVTLLPLQGEEVCLHFGYDHPLSVYFLDIEDEGEEYQEFGYGGRGFLPGERLSRGQMLEVLSILVHQVFESNLVKFRNAIGMDVPM